MSQSVIQGNPITLEAHYLDGAGNAITPSAPRVSILDPLNVTQVSNATPVNISVGIYQYTYTTASNAILGNWTAQWQGTINSQPLLNTEIFEVLPIGTIEFVPSGSYSYDPSTNVGVVRMLIDDRDMTRVSLSIPMEQRSAIFTDQEINTFISLNAGDTLYAAAQGLTTIAGNRQLLVQSRRIGHTAVNYGSVREDLLAQAMQLVRMSSMKPADALAEISYNDFGFRQVLINAQLRKSG
jgi:hypothetical protein